MQSRDRILGLAVVLALTLGSVWTAPAPAVAAPTVNPAPVQLFYVTLPEADGLTVLSTINSAAVTPMWTYFSIAIGVSGTYVYYDQWENGYDPDIANPANLYSIGNPGGTQIWGNGLAADGCPPNKAGVALTCTAANDVLNAGDVIVPFNSIPIPRNSNAILFDARDKVGASASIAMARATWATGSGTLNAFAHEMYSTAEWGTAYEAPVGCNTTSPGTDMFQYTGLSIMAAQNGTPIRVDADGNGTWDYTSTLNEGGTYLEGLRNRTGCDYVWQGARVESTDPTKPIQVVLVTGDIGSNYESRDMNLLPVSKYGSSYWSPVGVNTGNGGVTPGPTRLWLYNPSGNSSMTFTCERRDVVNWTSGSIAARGVAVLDLVNNQGARCYASQPFFAVGTVDTASGDSGQAWDWSFTLFSDDFLSTEALVGLGLGKDPTDTTSTQNGGPLWVTAACTSGGTYVYVDWNNDGVADPVDLNGDGDTNDTVDGISESASNNGMLVNRLYSVRLFEPVLDQEPYDQSGARVWSRTAANKPNRTDPTAVPGCNLAVAWGQDPRTASPGVPGLDVGTSIPPLRLVEGTKSLVVANDTEPAAVLNPGDTVTYNITVKNAGSVVVNNVYVYDTVPTNMSYVTGTTEKDLTSNNGAGPWVLIPDDGSGTPFPLDAAGGVLLGNLDPGDTFYVRFNATLLPGDYEDVTNCATVTTDAGEFVRCVTTAVATRDWGDLPDSYGTSAAQNGPRHSASGLQLGSHWDIEAQGNPTADARGDDTTLTPDDEDGITQIAWTDYDSGKFGVQVTGASGCLNAWMDFTNDTGSGAGLVNIDGNFTKAGGYDTYTFAGITYSEHIIANVLLAAGSHELTFPVPPGLLGDPSNSYYFRFRLSPPVDGACTSPIAPTGFVSGGEVEDYRFTYAPTAITLADFHAIQQGDAILVTWETVSELDNRGFNLYRGTSPDGWDRRLNAALIPSQSQGNPGGFIYLWEDTADLTLNTTYYYWLEDVDVYNVATLHGPVSVDFIVPTAVTLGGLQASPAAGGALPVAGALLALLASLVGTWAMRRRA